MKSLQVMAAAAVLFAAAPALADTAPVAAPATAAAIEVKAGAALYTADNRRLGRIEHVFGEKVIVIYDGRMIKVPVSTVSSGDRGFVTSLTLAQLTRR